MSDDIVTTEIQELLRDLHERVSHLETLERDTSGLIPSGGARCQDLIPPVWGFGLCNGQFEQGPTTEFPLCECWTAENTNVTRVTGGIAGEYCIKGYGKSGTGGYVQGSKYLPVDRTIDYIMTLCCWATVSTATVSAGVHCYNADKTYLSTIWPMLNVSPGVTPVRYLWTFGPGGTTWPADTRFCRMIIDLQTNGNLSNESAYVDDVRFGKDARREIQVPTAVKVLWGPGSLAGWNALYDTDYDLDSVDDAIGVTFMVEKDGTISKVGFYIRTFNGTPPAYKVTLQTVDATGLPTGTDYGGSAKGSFTPTATGWNWISLGTPATAVAGDIITAVISPDGTTPDGANSIDILDLATDLTKTLPRRVKKDIIGWSPGNGFPAICVQYDDDSVSMLGVTSCNRGSFDSASTPDEVGCKFTLPANMICYGARITFNSIESNATYTVKLYDSSDVLLASVVISDEDMTKLKPDITWDEVSLTAGATYRLTILATSALNINPTRLTFPDSDAMAWIPEGANWSGTERTDAGAWTDEALEMGYMAIWVNSITL